MVVSRKSHSTPPELALTLDGHSLSPVDTYKYLGVLLSKDLSWSPHIDLICSKARKILGLLYRRFYHFSEPDALRQLYISLVRPHVEYACHVWAPSTSRDINAVESVQKFFCKMATHNWNGTSYEELLSLTDLPTLEKRRVELKLCHMFKIVNNLIFFPQDVVERREEPLYHFRSFHNFTLSQPFARTSAYLNSFIPHTISLWNKLPTDVVSSPSLHSFKLHLHRRIT